MSPIYYWDMQNGFSAFTGFDWDDGNREKNLKHGVHASECEQVFFNEPIVILDDLRHSMEEERFAAFGRTDQGRRLMVVFTRRGSRLRVISARDMSRREKEFYENTTED